VSAHEHEAARPLRLDRFRQIDDFGNVGEVVAGKADRIRTPFADQPLQIAMRFDLQVEQPDLVPGFTKDGRNHLQAERFESQEHAGVHQATGMYGEHLHEISLRQKERVRDRRIRAGLSCWNPWYGSTAVGCVLAGATRAAPAILLSVVAA
jgi:hypothetical protein